MKEIRNIEIEIETEIEIDCRNWKLIFEIEKLNFKKISEFI